MKREIAFYATASQNLITIHYLKELIEHLQKKGPEVLFFRGISLLGDVYPSLGDRSMLDVDILVRERDLSRLTDALKGMGLTEAEPGVFCKPGFTLDVHTSFLNPSRTILERSCLTISMEDVFRKSVSKQLHDIQFRIPCPAHLFISTAIHLQSHSFGSHKGWEDLVRIRQYFGLAETEIISEAERMGAERTLGYLSYLRPDLLQSWGQKLTWGERWILKSIKGNKTNPNIGDLLFLFQSKQRGKALQEIFFPHGISLRIIVDRLRKCLLLLKEITMRLRKHEESSTKRSVRIPSPDRPARRA